jgi:hypothetical protein
MLEAVADTVNVYSMPDHLKKSTWCLCLVLCVMNLSFGSSKEHRYRIYKKLNTDLDWFLD